MVLSSICKTNSGNLEKKNICIIIYINNINMNEKVSKDITANSHDSDTGFWKRKYVMLVMCKLKMI